MNHCDAVVGLVVVAPVGSLSVQATARTAMARRQEVANGTAPERTRIPQASWVSVSSLTIWSLPFF
ncbi:MAG: hypothetical protein O6931_10410 [Gammaproteobacteria bacterium]|nr:hypothetical protein [Gammaproteobacteria bacterium]